MKIINIVENLDKGAVENWLVRVFIESKKIEPDWEWTFYCLLGKPGRLNEIVENSGGKIVYSPVSISNKLLFLMHLRKALQAGNYDIVHSHHDYLSGFYSLAMLGLSFKNTILHIHNTDEALPVGNPYLHKVLLPILKWIGVGMNKTIIGISEHTLETFIGKSKRLKQKASVLYYGISLNQFQADVDSQAFRAEVSLPNTAKIMLFIGRMNEFKNPLFVVEVLAEILKKRDEVYAVFVGEGDESGKVVQKAKELDLYDRIRILGWRNDSARIMKSSDVFIFPRLEHPKEGLGLVVVEAQAAALPMLITHAIVKDAIVIEKLAFYMELKNNPKDWANQVDKIISGPKIISNEDACSLMTQSRFDLRIATLNLLNLYSPKLV
ncbi:glycosyltransferase [Haliscomenobacter sp.]|uniref:glycosyltransferase n=1 Tax=Haliscomenobacter sp. TaxID=2717303 RepID=UPI003BA864BF